MAIEETYLSGEDSRLLREALANERGESLIEFGIGYGSNLASVKDMFTLIVGTDIRRTMGFKVLKKSQINLIQTDRASCIRNSSFDLVAINPPYLPSNEIKDIATDGGSAGFQITEHFLDDAFRVLKPDGKVLALLSSESDLTQFENYCRSNSIAHRIRLTKRIFYETLFVFELRKLKTTNN